MQDRVLSSDRYRIISHLARGGMADVYEAEDTLLNRRVAVKILHANFASDEAFVTRFKREAQAAANLSHPNIVAIYDWGQEGSTYYMVMELIEGRTLREILKSEGALFPRRAAEIAAETAAALTVAHQAGVVHRDIKPGNIMITHNGSVKVTDFGIARALDDSEELTKTGAVIGTATYFSPEQAQGLPADGRSDVYSLGVVLYEMLAARPPFTGESPVAVAYQHVSEYAPSVSQINTDVPPELSAVVEAAMAKNPDDRYATAADLRSDLLLFLSGRQPIVVGAAAAAAATALVPPPATVPPDETARAVAYQTEDGTSGQGTYVAAVIALLALLAVGVFILFRLFTGGASTDLVTIPDLKLAEAEAASRTLQELDLKVLSRLENSDTIPQGVVIDTEPVADTEVEKGSFVTLIESAGTEQFTVPQVIGETEEVARALIEAQNFQVGVVSYDLSEDVPEQTVISQNPSGGIPAAAGALVDLVVSKGPFSLEVPDTSGMSAEAAQLELAQAGFTNVVTEEEFSSDIAVGFTIRTEPEEGRVVGRDDTITLWVSKGPEPTTVPDLKGETIGDANAAATDAGLVLDDIGRFEVSAASGLNGLVAWQDPDAGTTVDTGTDVSVKIGVLKQVEVPNFKGMTTDEAATAGADVGLDVIVGGPFTVQPDDPNIGLVANQDPPAGESIDDGSGVAVFIGEVEQVTVPDVIGETEATAKTAIEGAGLVFAKTEAESDTVAAGDVISQDPDSAAGDVDKGTTVTVVVSTGSPTPTTTTP
ncbi:MAG: Stk1 family PASTA domain-containing Ser/Thr kinase [Actinomycetota bacterium]|nr:Stk1 family PASTA domain-containing Ser/Thr kinase [Actinomycetota bacterium]